MSALTLQSHANPTLPLFAANDVPSVTSVQFLVTPGSTFTWTQTATNGTPRQFPNAVTLLANVSYDVSVIVQVGISGGSAAAADIVSGYVLVPSAGGQVIPSAIVDTADIVSSLGATWYLNMTGRCTPTANGLLGLTINMVNTGAVTLTGTVISASVFPTAG